MTQGRADAGAGAALPAPAIAAVGRFQAALDALSPGVLQGLYLYGSAALGDFRAEQSDLDFAAVALRPWPKRLMAPLSELHAALARDQGTPSLDGIYVTWAELAAGPGRCRAPGALAGRFAPEGAFDANWAVWETLARYPVPLRGPVRPAVARDPQGLAAFCRENLASYWRGQAERVRRLGAAADASALRQAVAWCVPGVLRLWFTIESGDIASKAGALRWALDRAEPRWHPLVARALALREGWADPDPDGALGRGADGLAAFMTAVIESAQTSMSGPRR